MQISSSAFGENANIPSKYTCDGENISPPLKISNVNPSAKSLVLIVDDPDAPTKVWIHWLVYNINPEDQEVQEGELPLGGIPGMTDFNEVIYGGPCPPTGIHHYYFRIFALDRRLDLPRGSTRPEVEALIEGHIIDQAELVGVYQRTNESLA